MTEVFRKKWNHNYLIPTDVTEGKPVPRFSPSHSPFDLGQVKKTSTVSSLESTLDSRSCKFYPYSDPLYMNVRLPRLAHEWSTPHQSYVSSQVHIEDWEQDSHARTVQTFQHDNTANDVRDNLHEAEVPQSSISDNRSVLGQRVDDSIATMSALEGILHVRSHSYNPYMYVRTWI